MAEFRYGPVELYLVGFEGERPDPGVMSALMEPVESGHLRLLDFLLISKDDQGNVSIVEIEDDDTDYGLGDIALEEIGIAGEEDVEELAELVPPGSAAALIALELTFARTLASNLAASGGVVLSSERIPAPIVNAIVDAVEEEVAAEGVES
ncbi:DUF6325 family protein [Microbacterium sp. C7(2022)]|uniref:DUF6325 family protein n=1 Tax=Microbacterium sp. C7(2022) TaxID=2992759 RepID=UPI00237A1455|nr:DUF6325 family protein [Microbacterium sp. C7(2022)]MDE0546480.1 DUF6325 family protein [Microbacterium sp. C7(2022)]